MVKKLKNLQIIHFNTFEFMCSYIGYNINTDPDKRNYKVSAEKIKQVGFEPEKKIEDAFNEFKIKYEAGEIKDYKNSKYNNYNSLINSKEMQEKVFFKEL